MKHFFSLATDKYLQEMFDFQETKSLKHILKIIVSSLQKINQIKTKIKKLLFMTYTEFFVFFYRIKYTELILWCRNVRLFGSNLNCIWCNYISDCI
ncbi:hypothetical protein BpHYR1_015931 [Brachionus plicatilis]|uniref:Uncharacterized protein n=1 Tax=Brachionus plicatilis TaxID=10195 RepID=A0A3M7S6H4_BRAPC|nr:hypothetical protein BpHYR1_015931 [Brachionus plicatilis]